MFEWQQFFSTTTKKQKKKEQVNFILEVKTTKYSRVCDKAVNTWVAN